MMKNKKVIVFLESEFCFPQLIGENGAFGAPVRVDSIVVIALFM
jgi:hypothetical protein